MTGGGSRRNTPETEKPIDKPILKNTKLPEKVDGGQDEDRRRFNKGEFAKYCRDQMLHLCPLLYISLFDQYLSLSIKLWMYISESLSKSFCMNMSDSLFLSLSFSFFSSVSESNLSLSAQWGDSPKKGKGGLSRLTRRGYVCNFIFPF